MRLRAHAHRGTAAGRSRAAPVTRTPSATCARWFSRRGSRRRSAAGSPRSRSRWIPGSTSTSRSTTTSRSSPRSASCARSAARSSWRCRARTSSAPCWPVPGSAGRRRPSGNGPPPRQRRSRSPRAPTLLRLHDRSALDALRVAAAIHGVGRAPAMPRPPHVASAVDGVAASAGWERAIEPGRLDGRLVAESAGGARDRPRRSRSPPRWRPTSRRRCAPAGSMPSTRTSSRRSRRPRPGTSWSPAAPPRASRSASTCRSRRPRTRPRGEGALPVPDQGPGPGPGPKALGPRPWPLRHAIYDGDTPREDRPGIRRRSNLILTNPDMLHVGVLPHHKSWGDFLANLGWVVVDEAHTYRGVFGSHVANVLRRLRRLAGRYGSDAALRAGLGHDRQPGGARGAAGRRAVPLVDSDGAPRARRRIAMWNPPLIDPRSMTRRSVLSEAAELLADLVGAGPSHDLLPAESPGDRADPALHQDEAGGARPRRAGGADRSLPGRLHACAETRDRGAARGAGDLLAVVATDALELGIDIGHLDAAICVTFPGTVASLRQMWGRAGRRTRASRSTSPATTRSTSSSAAIPEEFLERPVEAAILDHENDRIQLAHLVAAAYELPLSRATPPCLRRALARARRGARLHRRASARPRGRYLPRSPALSRRATSRCARRRPTRSPSSTRPPASCSARSRPSGRSRPSTPAPSTCTWGAPTRSRELDLEARRAIVDPFDGDWYTQPKSETEVYIERIVAKSDDPAAAGALGADRLSSCSSGRSR